MSVIIQASKLVYFPHLLSTAYSSSLSSFALLRRGHAPLALEVIRLTICVSSIVLYVMMYCVSTRAAIPLSMTSMPDRCCELNASVGLLGTFPREIGLSVRLFVYLFVVLGTYVVFLYSFLASSRPFLSRLWTSINQSISQVLLEGAFIIHESSSLCVRCSLFASTCPSVVIG